MAAKTQYEVTADLIVVQVQGAQGGEVYLRRGAILPSTVSAREGKRLHDLELVKKVLIDGDTSPGDQAPPGAESDLKDSEGAAGGIGEKK